MQSSTVGRIQFVGGIRRCPGRFFVLEICNLLLGLGMVVSQLKSAPVLHFPTWRGCILASRYGYKASPRFLSPCQPHKPCDP